MPEIYNWLAGREHTLILALGDSITEANHCSEGFPNYLGLLDDRLRVELGKSRYAILNCAVGGAALVDSREYLQIILQKVRPDLVTVMFGMNDCARGEEVFASFRKSYLELLVQIMEQGAIPLALTQNPLDYGCAIDCIQTRKALPGITKIIRECAQLKGIPLVDVYQAWSEAILKKSANEHFKHLHDGIHPNHRGHEFIFQTIISTHLVH